MGNTMFDKLVEQNKILWQRPDINVKINHNDLLDTTMFEIQGLYQNKVLEIVQWQEEKVKKILEDKGYIPPHGTLCGKEVIHFIADDCDQPFVWVYRWNGKNWEWDGYTDNMRETISRYPFSKFVWVSIDPED